MNIKAIADTLRQLADLLEDAPVCFVPTDKPVGIGNRKPKPERVTRPSRVAPETIELVHQQLTATPSTTDAIVDATQLRKPTVLLALGLLIEQGKPAKVGDRRWTRWVLAEPGSETEQEFCDCDDHAESEYEPEPTDEEAAQ